MNFGSAVEALKDGHIVTRKGWNGEGMWLDLQVPDEHSKMTEPYIFMCIPKGDEKVSRVPWLASQTDILMDDWEIA